MRAVWWLFPLLVGCGGPPPASADPAPEAPAPEAPAPVRQVDVDGLKADLERGAVPLLVDVRSAAEYAEGHVPGAVNVPLDQLESRLGELGSKDQELYVICQSGRRSMLASATLASKGFRPVNVGGGTGAWIDAGHEVER